MRGTRRDRMLQSWQQLHVHTSLEVYKKSAIAIIQSHKASPACMITALNQPRSSVHFEIEAQPESGMQPEPKPAAEPEPSPEQKWQSPPSPWSHSESQSHESELHSVTMSIPAGDPSATAQIIHHGSALTVTTLVNIVV
jgi:hypothetical protein